jgi:thiol-disulfide isomerase/thioredoxin
MFKRSLVLVFSVLALVFVGGFSTQLVLSSQLPSAYDPGISIDEAFQSAETPILIEFYSDTCSTCQVITPTLHEVYKDGFRERLTLVMMNIEETDAYQVSQLFGVEAIPAVYVFNPKQMKKADVSVDALFDKASLKAALETALEETVVSATAPPIS